MKKIFMFTSVHNWNDTRIFYKEAVSLAKKYEVELHAPADFDFKEEKGIKICGLPQWKNRIDRIKIIKELWKRARNSNADIFHFHDPELIYLGLKIRKLGKKLIFDIHENIALQIRDKEYLPRYIRQIISFLYKIYEKMTIPKFDALLLAEKSYKEYYQNLSHNLEVVLNMPIISALDRYYSDERTQNELFYIGGVTRVRGVDVVIQTVKILKKKLSDIYMYYIGPYEKSLFKKLDLTGINENVKFYGPMPLFESMEYSKNAKVGLCILKPIDNYLSSYSTKIFEYMTIGLPVITSNFELYKNIIEVNNCGICVDPLDPKAIADAVEYIINNPKIAQQMGKNGRKAVEEKYNWGIEENKLLKLYEEILK